ncbi:MAG: hypothetical protein QXS20_01800 [Candidatus Thorarchaeota archaeon]
MRNIGKYYALISGDMIDLARAEVESLLNMIGNRCIVDWRGRLAVISSDHDPTDFLLQRASFARAVGEILFTCDRHGPVSSDALSAALRPDQTFRIDVIAQDHRVSSSEKKELIMKWGRSVHEATGGTVNLESPNARFALLVDDDHIMFCRYHESHLRRELRSRLASKKPFFHPSMMNSVVARALCNLGLLRAGEVLLDPFCGAGGILCEAALMGAYVVGIDSNPRLLRGARMNLASQCSTNSTLILGDSRFIPISGVSLVVTDPPYGRTSSTRGHDAVGLVRRFFAQTDDILVCGGRVCICADSEMNIGDILDTMGMPVELRVKVPVHAGLCREIFRVRI